MTNIVLGILLAVVIVLCIWEVVVNKLNPIPKMKDKGEEMIFGRTICKTRKMYSAKKR